MSLLLNFVRIGGLFSVINIMRVRKRWSLLFSSLYVLSCI